jgi:hypothetical protein
VTDGVDSVLLRRITRREYGDQIAASEDALSDQVAFPSGAHQDQRSARVVDAMIVGVAAEGLL